MNEANGTGNSAGSQRKSWVSYRKVVLLFLPTLSVVLAVDRYDRTWVKNTLRFFNGQRRAEDIVVQVRGQFGDLLVEGLQQFVEVGRAETYLCTCMRLDATR
jgi:hypothetical protein